MIDLDAIRARAEAAKDGPWSVEPFGNPDEYEIGAGAVDRWGRPALVVSCGEPAEAQGIALADAEFIAHAREDVPALLAEVESLRHEVATDDEILAHRQRLIDAVDAIEECRAHGSGCIPHAVDWVERTAAEVERLRAALLAASPTIRAVGDRSVQRLCHEAMPYVFPPRKGQR